MHVLSIRSSSFLILSLQIPVSVSIGGASINEEITVEQGKKAPRRAKLKNKRMHNGAVVPKALNSRYRQEKAVTEARKDSNAPISTPKFLIYAR